MYCLIYTSKAKRPFSDEELVDLLIAAKAANFERDVTGMLLYKHGQFLQVIEGEQGDVKRLIDKISADPRHENLTQIYSADLTQRNFPNWSMGFHNMDNEACDKSFEQFFQTKCHSLLRGPMASRCWPC